jgi:hypothetical protein
VPLPVFPSRRIRAGRYTAAQNPERIFGFDCFG